MPNIPVVGPTTNADAAVTYQVFRGAQIKTAIGTIASDKYAVGDTISFQLDIKELIKAEFASAHGGSLDIFNSANIANPIPFDVSNSGATSQISYNIEYVFGSGVGSGNPLVLTVSSTTN